MTTTFYINDCDELDMIDTAIANAKYIFEDSKMMTFLARANSKIPHKKDISYPHKVKLTKQQWRAFYDAITHDREWCQGSGARGSLEETDPESSRYILDDEDAIRCHKLCKAYDRFIKRRSR